MAWLVKRVLEPWPLAGLADPCGALWETTASATGRGITQSSTPRLGILQCLASTPDFFITMLSFEAIPKSVTTLLSSLAGSAALEGFALGGGTSLALRFAHCLSVVLYFFTEREFSPE